MKQAIILIVLILCGLVLSKHSVEDLSTELEFNPYGFNYLSSLLGNVERRQAVQKRRRFGNKPKIGNEKTAKK